MKRILISLVLMSSPIFAANVTKEFTDDKTTTYRIEMNETEQVTLDENNATVVIDKIEDHRCPPGKMCFWPGAIVVDLKVTQERTVQAYQMQYMDKPLLLNLNQQSLLLTKMVKKAEVYQMELKFLRPSTLE